MSAQCVMICSGKGGTGKSTVSVLLGAGLARLGRKVLLVELDSGLRIPARAVNDMRRQALEQLTQQRASLPPLPSVRAATARPPQHARSHLPSACRSTPALTFRSRAAPAGARGPAGLASASSTCRRGHSSTSRIRLPPRDGAGWHGSAPAVHPRPPAWPFHPLLLRFS